ncbi:MAG TPA: Slp family lipoprotein [Xanthomonadaceae bacterium]|nr:Slp family lipoprotein [Xanthomonadaceae bacterium]
MTATTARIALITLAVALASGCATAPKPLRGEYAVLSPAQASDAGQTGPSVRWGGQIIEVDTGAERTCFEVLGRDLNASARPRSADTSNGRFLACREGFYDPALFAPEREITVIGRIDGYETRPVGEYRYRYPRVDAELIFLWPERDESDVYYVGTMGWYGRPYWWGGYYLRPYPGPRHKAAPRTKD